MLRSLDAAAVRGWCEAARSALAAGRAQLDDLNVFPVPDGDTGTNLLLTFEAVEEAVRAVPAGPGELGAVAAAMAHGALLGARGSSGVLVSQLVRGLADVLAAGPAGPAGLAEALTRGAAHARAAVARPVEGTVLTVADAAAAAGEEAAASGGGLAAVASAAALRAREALARTPGQLAALQEAGVVDAGGLGWVLLLDALEQVAGDRLPGPLPAPHVARARGEVAALRETGSAAYSYEVQYLLRDTSDPEVVRLQAVLADLGDSLVVVGSRGVFNVHVHVNDVGAALEAGVDAGRPFRVTVTRFADRDADRVAEPGSGAAPPGPATAGRLIVAVADGPGLSAVLEAAGAVVLEAGPPAPTPAAFRAVVQAAGAEQIVVLAAGAAAVAAGAAARALPTVDLRLVPASSGVQALAALAVADPARPFAQDVRAMSEAAAATRNGEVRPAVTTGPTSAGMCVEGDALGLLDGRVVAVGADPERVARGLLDRLAPGAEIVTLVLGRGAPEGAGERLRAYVVARHAGVEVVVVDGGQERVPILIGAE